MITRHVIVMSSIRQHWYVHVRVLLLEVLCFWVLECFVDT